MKSSWKTETLKDNIKLYVSGTHTFGTDAILLAHFAKPKKKDNILDMGTGCGIIPMLWLCEKDVYNLSAMDIQKEAVEMARASFKENGFKVNVFEGDLKEAQNWKEVKPAVQDLITMNPPYFAKNSGAKNIDMAERIARHEGVGCAFEDVVKAAEGLLKYGGRFCFCHRPDRLVDTMMVLREYKLEPKRLRFAQAHTGKEPWLFLCEAKKGSKSGLKIEPNFLVYDNIVAGNKTPSYSKEYKEIYKWYLKYIDESE